MTKGISPKVLVPVLGIAVGILVHWIATGEFDRVEISAAVADAWVLVTGYLASPGEVVTEVGPPSDTVNEGSLEPPKA